MVLRALIVAALLAAPVEQLGRSYEGRPIDVVHVAGTGKRILVVGCIHGNECAGRAVTRRLRRVRPPAGSELWVVDDLNPDGRARGTRQNARGVDLNRNFSRGWRRVGRRGDVYYSGRRPFSEPETRIARRLILRVRPVATIWFHQHLALVVRAPGGDVRLQRRYARRVRLPLRSLGQIPGTATRWQNHRFRRSTAFVVELRAGGMSRRAVARHVRAIRALARPPAGAAARRDVDALRPRITRRLIPFSRRRKRETAAYAKRHYGHRTWRLRSPKVIVEHVAVASSVRAVYDSFAPDRRDPELHELPGVCSHFVVGRTGRIYQLVPLGIICRHTVGLNDVAIGIEHVGFRDGDVLGNARQLRASLRLSRWLRCRYGIRRRNVIGHNESLSSPYHHERVRRLRRQTHGDFRRPSMRRYRRRLARLPC
jgi:N-acetylmuramoyl-L-alanine amidase-like protein/zinc carboxypeptidase